jgi:hypothetical protein
MKVPKTESERRSGRVFAASRGRLQFMDAFSWPVLNSLGFAAIEGALAERNVQNPSRAAATCLCCRVQDMAKTLGVGSSEITQVRAEIFYDDDGDTYWYQAQREYGQCRPEVVPETLLSTSS